MLRNGFMSAFHPSRDGLVLDTRETEMLGGRYNHVMYIILVDVFLLFKTLYVLQGRGGRLSKSSVVFLQLESQGTRR